MTSTPWPVNHRIARWALVGLVLTAAVGAALRLVFVGLDPAGLGGRFAAVRHAHSHLGYYLFLFPTLWLAWRDRPGPRAPLVHAYAVVSLLAGVTFALRGYWWPSIAASTFVGGVWGYTAWRARARFDDWRDWTLPAVALSLAMVVPIAVLTSRQPATAAHLVRAFLTVLLLGGMLPHFVGAARVPRWLWGLATTAAAFGGGFEIPAVRLLGYGATGAILLAALHRDRAVEAHVPRHLWTAAALGFWAYASGLAAGHGAALAGVHFVALGPVAVGQFFVGQRRPVSALLWPYLATVVVMSGALAAGDLGGGLLATRLAAWSGVGAAVLVVPLALGRLWSRPQSTGTQ